MTLIVGRQAFHGVLGVTANGLQQVVELVGDATGQRADGFELVGLPQLLVALGKLRLQFFAVGNVGQSAGKMIRRSLVIVDRLAAPLHPNVFA